MLQVATSTTIFKIERNFQLVIDSRRNSLLPEVISRLRMALRSCVHELSDFLSCKIQHITLTSYLTGEERAGYTYLTGESRLHIPDR